MQPVSWPIMTSALRFLDRDLDLAVDGEGARELALGDDVAEAEAAAVVPGLVVDHLRAERWINAGRDGDAVAVEDVVVVDRVLRHHLVDVARRMDRRADGGGVDHLMIRRCWRRMTCSHSE